MKNIVHWCKQKAMWTSHTYKACSKSPVVLIQGGWEVEIKPKRRTNPRGWVVSEHTQVVLNPPASVLSQYKKTGRLLYNKEAMKFNYESGTHLLFDEEGCHLLERSI